MSFLYSFLSGKKVAASVLLKKDISTFSLIQRLEYWLMNKLNSCCSWPGPSCSKLTMSLVHVLLNVWSLNMAYTLELIAEKKNVSSSSYFFSKNTCELDIVLTRTFNILTTNELVKLTMLWTTRPRYHAGSIWYIVRHCLWRRPLLWHLAL